MEYLHKLAQSVTEEPKAGWILGPLSYAIVYRKCNIGQTEPRSILPKAAQR